jgi:hypothetical protein
MELKGIKHDFGMLPAYQDLNETGQTKVDEFVQLALSANHNSPLSQITHALHDRVIAGPEPQNTPNDTETLSAKTIYGAAETSYIFQEGLFRAHLGEDRCEILITEHIARNPLLVSISRETLTPRMRAHAINKGLQYEARAAGIDISDIKLNSPENIKTVKNRIAEANDAALIKFFDLIKDTFNGNAELAGILNNIVCSSEEQAASIRLWINNHQEQVAGIMFIDLKNSELIAIPQEIKFFTSLRTLNISNNKLVALPEVIGDLVKLNTLNLGNNKLVSLPATIGNLGRLSCLLLNDNELKTLPYSSARINLVAYGAIPFDLRNNPFEDDFIHKIHFGIYENGDEMQYDTTNPYYGRDQYNKFMESYGTEFLSDERHAIYFGINDGIRLYWTEKTGATLEA